MFTNDLHPEKAPHLITRPEAGIATLLKEVQPLKAYFSMVPTESGIATLSNEVHPLKAPISMVVTEFGIVKLTNELHPLNAYLPMVVVDSGMAACPFSSGWTQHDPASASQLPTSTARRTSTLSRLELELELVCFWCISCGILERERGEKI